MQEKELSEMIEFYESYLEKTVLELDQLKKEVSVNGKLRAAHKKNGYQYFIRTKETNTNGIYIKKEHRKTAMDLAQIEYDEKLIEVLQDGLSHLKNCRALWSENPFLLMAEQMPLGKRKLLRLPYVSDESFLLSWQNHSSQMLPFKEDANVYYTRQGIRVRSKSEVIIADILDEMKLPFLYEKPLSLASGNIYPDFTLMNIKERKEVYWEHFGMMDDAEYRDHAYAKMRKYEENGYFQGDTVIWTFETGRLPIRTREIRKMINVLKKVLGY